MDKQIEILAVCVHEGIKATIIRLINNSTAPWQARGAGSVSEARELLDATHFDVVLLGNGLSAKEELELTAFVQANHSDTKLVTHYGGGSGLLFGEIHEALAR